MTEKKKQGGQRGFAAHPENINREGRKPGEVNALQENRDFRQNIKALSQEAVDNIKDIMRSNKKIADVLLEEYQEMSEELRNLKEEEKPDKKRIQELEREKKSLMTEIRSLNKEASNYSLKIIDHANEIVLHEEKSRLERKKLKDKNSVSGNDSDDDDYPEVLTSSGE